MNLRCQYMLSIVLSAVLQHAGGEKGYFFEDFNIMLLGAALEAGRGIKKLF